MYTIKSSGKTSKPIFNTGLKKTKTCTIPGLNFKATEKESPEFTRVRYIYKMQLLKK